MLAAEGMEVSLLHHDSPLTEVRGAFQIQLQVAEVDFARSRSPGSAATRPIRLPWKGNQLGSCVNSRQNRTEIPRMPRRLANGAGAHIG